MFAFKHNIRSSEVVQVGKGVAVTGRLASLGETVVALSASGDLDIA